MKIALQNKSQVCTDEEVIHWMTAVNIQVQRDVLPHWGFSLVMEFKPKEYHPAKDEWLMIVQNEDKAEDEDGLLGFHERDNHGKPIGYVFALTAQNAGESPSVTLSHEVIELIGNRWVNAVAEGPDARHRMIFYELCDPVEGDIYKINGVEVSNFILPNWFDKKSDAPWDFLKKLEKPFSMTPGGYLMVWNQEKGWHDSFTNKLRPRTQHSRRGRFFVASQKSHGAAAGE